jgi:hypothetical protein
MLALEEIVSTRLPKIMALTFMAHLFLPRESILLL